MQSPRTLLKNTRASLRFHKRLIMFLVALLVLIVGVVALGNGLSQSLTAAGDSTGSDDTDGGTSVSWGTGGSTQGSISIFTTSEPVPPTSTPTPSTPTTTSTPTPSPFIPFTDTPEYGVGGGIIALLACFVAFTLYMRKTKAHKVD